MRYSTNPSRLRSFSHTRLPTSLSPKESSHRRRFFSFVKGASFCFVSSFFTSLSSSLSSFFTSSLFTSSFCVWFVGSISISSFFTSIFSFFSSSFAPHFTSPFTSSFFSSFASPFTSSPFSSFFSTDTHTRTGQPIGANPFAGTYSEPACRYANDGLNSLSTLTHSEHSQLL